MPVRTKRLVVDKYMETSRFEEEVKLLQKEMMGFVKYYKDTMLHPLMLQQQKLHDLLKGIVCNYFAPVLIFSFRHTTTSNSALFKFRYIL